MLVWLEQSEQREDTQEIREVSGEKEYMVR